MAQIAKESLEICKRIDSLLKKASKDADSFYDFAAKNTEIIEYAFLARAVIKGLIDPSPELLISIAAIEKEFTTIARNIEKFKNDVTGNDELNGAR